MTLYYSQLPSLIELMSYAVTIVSSDIAISTATSISAGVAATAAAAAAEEEEAEAVPSPPPAATLMLLPVSACLKYHSETLIESGHMASFSNLFLHCELTKDAEREND